MCERIECRKRMYFGVEMKLRSNEYKRLDPRFNLIVVDDPIDGGQSIENGEGIETKWRIRNEFVDGIGVDWMWIDVVRTIR
mmetsp:Transcript_7780/g.14133  ORF Transcript_7780/g.14133 Transcript_7780/m.14133 type:complete len:81 (-) Transcript_7780:227-469(-)